MNYLPTCSGAGSTGDCVRFSPYQLKGCTYYMVLFFASPSADALISTIVFVYSHLGICQYLDNVVGAGSPKYDQAYFEVNYLRAYTTGSPAPSSTGAINNVGSTALPSQNSGVSSYFRPRWFLSLGVVTTSLLFCGFW